MYKREGNNEMKVIMSMCITFDTLHKTWWGASRMQHSIKSTTL